MTHRASEPRQPLRTCIGCRRRDVQSRLVRCVVGPAGAEVSRTAPGRGAWLCSAACLDTARRRKAFERAWRRPLDAGALDGLLISFGPVGADVRTSSTARDAVPGPAEPRKG